MRLLLRLLRQWRNLDVVGLVRLLEIFSVTAWRWSLHPRRFRDVVARYSKPLIIGGFGLFAIAAYPGASLEGFKAGLAGGIVWEVGKHIILG